MVQSITETKIILLWFIPIVNSFNFPPPSEKWQFFDLTEIRKKWFTERKNSPFSKEQWLEMSTTDYSSKIEEIIHQNKSAKKVIINYPLNEKQFASFQQILEKQNKKVDQIILLTILKYELILSLKNKYLICPLCEKITDRTEAVQNLNTSEKEKVFVCPHDKEHSFKLTEIEQFNEWIIEYHLRNTKKITEKFLSTKLIPRQLTINRIEDIFSGKIQTEILKAFESL
ncbi:MAG: hypothetical protein MRERC_2c055 [Mycoplasmataceae bacterium RC_NB112A]|nr:MAG: hypothetical protein MRERC_2c055 [Mycoplasmataceae bacterium RC_NB112A]